ncbi:DUF4426 domain-containing protein [Aeromonas simiae]|uniref:DUF4426 domain-containing protein n=1 Tax=Aeromonas simiae TaxID=218936 RepID=UPI0005A869EF|nr:DUF4426 domain-containing protein [Aeromonas simiae]MDO2950056.1 DUF4426 domain-containing protein [Aeromonas simiae]MDO2953732.1 DUF4426 domain-containing protein [Aeromonas simiae]MDO2957425.1 DUF4426 domain-containing protein [Aeromonas simiae]
MRAWCIGLLLLLTLPAQAEQSMVVGPWRVYYSAFPSTFLSADIAKQYQLTRSRYAGLINVAIHSKEGEPLALSVIGEARNLTGTVRQLAFREIREGPAIYYLAELPYRNEDTYRIQLTLMGMGQTQQMAFQQTFYVEQE